MSFKQVLLINCIVSLVIRVCFSLSYRNNFKSFLLISIVLFYYCLHPINMHSNWNNKLNTLSNIYSSFYLCLNCCHCTGSLSFVFVFPFFVTYLFIFIFRQKPSWFTEFGFNVLLICGCKQFSGIFFVVFWLGFSNLVFGKWLNFWVVYAT